MKKPFKIIIGLILLLIFLSLVYLFISGQIKKDPSFSDREVYYPTAREAANWNQVMPREALVVEYMSDEEASDLGLSTSTEMQLQVIQRDEDGNILEYRKIRSEQDIKRYKY